MEKEKFDPKDEKYKEVADLPPKHQEEFMDVKGGGFVSRDAVFNEKAAEKEAYSEKNDMEWEAGADKRRQEILEADYVRDPKKAEKMAHKENNNREEFREKLLPIIKRLKTSINKQDLEDKFTTYGAASSRILTPKRVHVMLKDGSELSGYHGFLWEKEEDGEAFYVIGSNLGMNDVGGTWVDPKGRQDIPVQDIKKIIRRD